MAKVVEYSNFLIFFVFTSTHIAYFKDFSQYSFLNFKEKPLFKDFANNFFWPATTSKTQFWGKLIVLKGLRMVSATCGPKKLKVRQNRAKTISYFSKNIEYSFLIFPEILSTISYRPVSYIPE